MPCNGNVKHIKRWVFKKKCPVVDLILGWHYISRGSAFLAKSPQASVWIFKIVCSQCSLIPSSFQEVIKELRSPQKQVSVVGDKTVPLSPKKYTEEKKNASKQSLLDRVLFQFPYYLKMGDFLEVFGEGFFLQDCGGFEEYKLSVS